MTNLPILWSFRRCPYAIRARMAIRASRTGVVLREILLKDKPEAFLAASPSGTVPCLETTDLTLDESRDIMIWALDHNDPFGWRDTDAHHLIDTCDGAFKTALDHTKYAVRFPRYDAREERDKAAAILIEWNARLTQQPALSGARFGMVDAAILPFVRQFAGIDRVWFDAQPWPALRAWLDRYLQDPVFTDVMGKYAPWQPNDAETVIFPATLQSVPKTGFLRTPSRS